LLKLDFFQVEHYTLLPFFILLAIYASWLVAKIPATHSILIWKGLTFIVGMLVIFNIAKIASVEIKKLLKPITYTSVKVDPNSAAKGYPDIYYIILDEFSGFEPMRKYWHNQKVDGFVKFLKSKGFFIAEQSHGSSIWSIHQMITRLNYQEYPSPGPKDRAININFEPLYNNKVMRYLKSRGYATAVFNEMPWKFKAMPPIIADYSINYKRGTMIDFGVLFDEFGVLLADNSMLRAFSKFYIAKDPEYIKHKNMIFNMVNKIAAVNEVASPKFVYVHLLLPHDPFMFDQKGNMIDQIFYDNWNYYLGQYNFTLDIAKKMIENILATSDPKRHPVIILQSDHGCRNILNKQNPKSAILDNFPPEYRTHILFTLYMPGYDASGLAQDINPINTFPIVFNYLFAANIPLK